MRRVMLLAPFLLLLSSRLSRGTDTGEGKTGIVVPWFAVLFIAVAGFNSLQLLPAPAVDVLVQIDTVLLAMAMAALGLRTHVGAIRQAGIRPLLLAAALFVFLLVGGYARSEEHTSELQSLMRISYAVFRLKTNTDHQFTQHHS